jgi:hypothetical protein
VSALTDADVFKYAIGKAQQLSAAGNTRDYLRTLLFLLTLDPKRVDVREHAARLLYSLKELKYRAEARDILEEGLTKHGISHASLETLIEIYLGHGPIERAKVVLQDLESTAKQIYGDANYERIVKNVDALLESGTPKTSGSIQRTRYPSETDFSGPLDKLFERHIANGAHLAAFQFQRTDKVFTMGSCFAGRVSRVLNERGINSFALTLAETVNTTHANRDFLSYLLDLPTPHTTYWTEELEIRGHEKTAIMKNLQASDLVVYTLGVAPAFFNKTSGAFTPHSANAFKTRSFVGDNVYRMTSVEENLENLKFIFALLRKVNPKMRLVLSVSPVPLQATFERDSAIISDCVSKSTLRIVAEEFCKNETANSIYWPSFEMIKWVSPHREKFFGTDDGDPAHISGDVVAMVVDTFLKTCLRQEQPPQA